MTTGPPHDTGIDAAILDRMTDTLIILQAKSATTDRGKMIAALQTLRGRHPDAQVILVESESDARVIRECLQSIERTSLGTPSARRTRAKATADRIADILIRHQELPESNDGVVPTNHDDRDEDARLEVMQTAHRDVADAIQRHNLPLIPGPKPPADYRETGDSLQDSPVGALQISRHQTGFWDELTALGVIGHQAATWREQIQGLLSAGALGRAEPPAGLRASMRPYQQDGFGWLAFLWEHQLGGILADDMGLGKTLQCLALISHARQRDPAAAPFLIIAPASVVAHWAEEATRFAPDLNVVPVTGTMARRDQDLGDLVASADAVVTSYTLLRLDFEAYAKLGWSGLLLDEAQQVKNRQSKVYQYARRLAAPVKIAITCTPLENNLMELWSLLSITAPGLFPSSDRFRDYYARPVEQDGDTKRLAQLQQQIMPLVLRRTKEQVAADLPARQEQVLEIDLHPQHRKIYQMWLQRERQKVLGLTSDMDSNQFAILRSLTVLRQLSLHAGLVDEAYAGLASAKIDALLGQLRGVIGGGHRALVFSQFTGFLGKVRERLEAEGIPYSYLDGSTRSRSAVVHRFKAGTAPVFLISLKSGGFGLNLTEADYCFLLDPWWNLATEMQAVDRIHRIGQTRNVMVYRLVAKDTIEEKVMALQARKARLFSTVLEDRNISAVLDDENLSDLLDARDVFGDGLDGRDVFGSDLNAADIRLILA